MLGSSYSMTINQDTASNFVDLDKIYDNKFTIAQNVPDIGAVKIDIASNIIMKNIIAGALIFVVGVTPIYSKPIKFPSKVLHNNNIDNGIRMHKIGNNSYNSTNQYMGLVNMNDLKNGQGSDELNNKANKYFTISNHTTDESIKRIDSIGELQDNWNGNDAKSFNRNLIIKCKEIVINLPVQPDIFPTACNSIQLEYELQSGKYLELNIFEQSIDVYTENEDGKEEEWTINNEEYIEQLNRLVKDFYGQ